MKKIISKLKFFKKKTTPWFRRDYKKFVSLSKDDNIFIINDDFPCIKDKYLSSGELGAGGHYFWQDIYVAHEIFINNPIKHVDIGSRIDGFIAHLSVFREIEVFDIRLQNNKMKNVTFKQADLMKIDALFYEYCDSISCLHTLEHFGLGRYGDEIDPIGHLKGFKSITSILKPNGYFYFSVPLGPNKIEFNAHRIFSLQYLLDWIQLDYIIEKFSYIDDQNQLFNDIEITSKLISNNCGCVHGCAIFTLKKNSI